ncbi:MAG TPA: MFS transporter, partial [Candidatus Binatia bacterium]|nr:MFS transporter [Candidatus Binatia bacterium]
FWLWMVRGRDLGVGAETDVMSGGAWRELLTRRMGVVLVVVALINTCWQTFRPWLTKFLIEGRGYAEGMALNFNSLFFIASDVGCVGAGALALWLARRGMAVHRSRMLVFFGCALLSGTGLLIPLLPRGWPLLCVLLLVAAGSLGVFPVYHALTQDISAQHQGKVTGIAGIAAWGFAPPAQKFFGRIVDKTGSFDAGLAIAGCLPLIAFVVLVFFWNRRTE